VTDYARPSYLQLKARIETDLAALPAVLRSPLSAAWARACHSQHGFLEWIDRQCSPLTSDIERLYDWAALYGSYRLLATYASGFVLATGTPGSTLLADTVLRGQNGLDYKVLAAVTLVSGDNPVSVRCVTAGRAGNLGFGQVLTLVDPVAGVSGSLSVDGAGLSGGEDDEALVDWQARIASEWLATVTYGGRAGRIEDYLAWAKAAHPSVSTALIQPHAAGLGTLIIRPICNGLTNRLPTSPIVADVTTYLLAKAPATADFRVLAPVVHGVSITVYLYPGFNTLANQNAITAALAALVLREQSETSLLTLAEIDAAIASVTSQYVRLAPLADIAVGAGNVFVLQPVTWATSF
jgi:uncharacterized phage protein gp47/JayE